MEDTCAYLCICQLSIISVPWVHTNDLQGQARHRSVSTLVRGYNKLGVTFVYVGNLMFAFSY